MEHGKSTAQSSTTPTKQELTTLQLSAAQKTDDNLSIKSSDSVTTSGEYEIVPEVPALGDALSSPVMNVAPAAAAAGISNLNIQLDPVRETRQFVDLNPTDCFEEDEVVVNLLAAVLSTAKLDAISPILNIEGNGNVLDLEKNMDEVIHELDEERTLSASDGEPGSANKSK